MASDEFRNKFMSLQGNLLNYAFMLTSHKETAHRLLDSTMKVAFEHWADATDDASLKCWAFSIMRGVFAADFEHQRAVRRDSNDVYAIRLVDGSETAVSYLEGVYRSADVTGALMTLTDGYRRIIGLFFAGYSIAEISAEMNLPVREVKNRVAYCRTRLKVSLSA